MRNIYLLKVIGMVGLSLGTVAAATAETVGSQSVDSWIGTSLAGTVPDGNLGLDEKGELRVDLELRRFFDYFLSARGEMEDTRLRRAVQLELMKRLPSEAGAQALELFDRYTRYQEEGPARLGDAPEKALRDASFVAQAYDRLTVWRVEVFGSDQAASLFGSDLAGEAAALSYQAARLDAASPVQMDAARKNWEASLSAAEQRDRARALGPVEIQKQVQALRVSGAGESEIWRVRAEAFGPDAADRLDRLDGERAQWQQRLTDYRAQRDAIERSKVGESAERVALETLLAESFSPAEQKRVRALDRIDRGK